MLRKLSLVAVAAASLGVAALAPTSASAWGGWHGGWHRGWGWGGPRFFVGGPAYGYLCYYYWLWLWLRRLLRTPAGSDAVGTPLAADKSLLLIQIAASASKRPRSLCDRGLLPDPNVERFANLHSNFTKKPWN